MSTTKKTKRRPWEKAEVRHLKVSAGKIAVTTIARKIRRTPGATRQKAFSLGVSLDTRDGPQKKVA